MLTSPTQLRDVNEGVSRYNYDEISATREISNANFASGGQIVYRFHLSGIKKCQLSKSFLRLKMEITKDVDAAVEKAQNVYLAHNMGSNFFQSMQFRINGQVVSSIENYVPQIDSLKKRLYKSTSHLKSVEKSLNVYESDEKNRQIDGVKTFEIIYKPPLSVWDSKGALIPATYELVLVPNKDYLKTALKFDNEPAGLKIKVESMRLNLAMYEDSVVSDGSYFMDLEEIRCQARDISSRTEGTNHTSNFLISPSTTAISAAFQDTRAPNNAAYETGKFQLEGKTEKSVQHVQFKYAGQTFPQVRPDYSGGTLLQLYHDFLTHSGSINDVGGAESYVEFRDGLGLVSHYLVRRDGLDRSTRCDIDYKIATAFANTNLMVFDHYTNRVRIDVVNGNIQNVQVEEA